MTIREDIEPTLIAERVCYETHERNAKILESMICEHAPQSLAENIKTVAKQLREAARKCRTRYEEIWKELEEKYSVPQAAAGGDK